MNIARKPTEEMELLDLDLKEQQIELLKAQIRQVDAETERIKKSTALMDEC